MGELKQSDVDALIGSMGAAPSFGTTGQRRQVFGANPREASASEIRPYDFRRPERVSKDQMRTLHTLHEGFARSLGASLSGFLRTIIEIKVASCEQMTYSGFIDGLPNPTSFNLITADELDGQMCLEISPLIIYPIIDRLLGGNSADLFIPQRPMTQIEARLVANVTSRGLAALTEAWEGVRELHFKLEATEANPQLVQIVPPNEVVIVVSLEVRMGQRAGTMNLCIPYNVIEPLMDELEAQSWFSPQRAEDAARSREHITRGVTKATVEATAILAETSMTLSDLKRLEIGDLIATESSAAGPVVFKIEDESKYQARVGQHKRMRAVQIAGIIAPNGRA